MKRRQLLRYMAASGLSLTFPTAGLLAQPAMTKRFFVCVNAGGGWDPTAFIDPKGNAPRLDGRGPVNNYSAAAITQVGNIAFPADYSDLAEEPDSSSSGHFANFFSRHASRLLVVNGIDTQTNNHDAGARFIWSGKIESGYPSFAALAAAANAPDEALAFISNGGYDNTAGLVAPARIGSGDVFQLLAFPEAARPGEPQGERHNYFQDDVYHQIEAARHSRLERLHGSSTLPMNKQQMAELMLARSGDSNLNRLVELLPERVSNGLAGQAEVAVAAFASGVAVSANLHIGGFDTHGNHDFNQSRRLTQLLEGVDQLWTELERQGLEDRVTVIVGSDFGRTPFYNDNRGKDHWNVTSMMFMGAGIRGNRVIGATDEHVEALAINPDTLLIDPDGIVLTPQHIHQSLRSLAGVNSALRGQFGIIEPSLNLFS